MKRQVTPDSPDLHERASASVSAPNEGGTQDSAAWGGAVSDSLVARAAALELAAQQRWFLDAITTPTDVPAPITAEQAKHLVTPGPQLDALGRLAIYRTGYHARLHECLLDDYPALAHALGSDGFATLCADYVAARPSNSPSLNHFGEGLPAFCAAQRLESGFFSELATLEWAIVKAIHAPSAATLEPDAIARLAPEDWESARLVANPSVQLLSFRFPVNGYYQAVRDEQAPELPAPEVTHVAVYRSGRAVWRLDLADELLSLVRALIDGVPLGQALEAAAEGLAGLPEAEVATRVTTWFRDAVASGLFCDIARLARA